MALLPEPRRSALWPASLQPHPLFAVLLFLSCPLLACSPAEVDPIRLPVRERLPEASTEYPLELLVFVRNERQLPLQGIKVSAISGGNKLEVRSGTDGAASLKLPYAPDSDIDFEFRSAERYWVKTMSSIPQGVRRIRFYFDLGLEGEVNFARMEY